MKYWLCASALAAGLLAAAQSPRAFPQEPSAPPRANELTLAGLRPGKDTLATAEKRYKPKYRNPARDTNGTKEWWDACNGRSLNVDIDSKGVVQSVTVSALAPRAEECNVKPGDPLGQRFWATGRGLKLSDPRDRVIELYGEPASSGPSTKGTRELESLFYAFDWAGSDVPQVMEVACERSTGRVIEIMLASPSL